MNNTPIVERIAPKTEAPASPLAYDIKGAIKEGNVGRSKIFEEISAGRLKARKVGRRTIILREDLVAWLAALPTRQAAAA